MSRSPEDTATTLTVGDIPEILGDGDVIAYLRENPDFFVRHPDLLAELTPPKRWSDDRIVDMHQVMVLRLRDEIDSLRTTALDLIEISRSNMSVQTRTLTGVLALLGAADLRALLRVIVEELPLILALDVVTLAFEPGARPLSRLIAPDIGRLERGAVDALLGPGDDVALFDDMLDDGTVFGAGAGLVRSAALARLRANDITPAGLLALGSRDAGTFHPGQGSDLVAFLARVLEPCLHKCLAAPA